MILVDTSVLIDYLKEVDNIKTALFHQILNDGIIYGISNHIYMELLQGARNQKEFGLLKDYLDTQHIYGLTEGLMSYQQAARLNYDCRRKGVTIRSTIDLIIAQTAIENNLYLLHNDADFDNIASVVPALKIFHGIKYQ